MTAHLRLNPSSSEADVADAFAAHYADAPLVRMRREPPDSKWVRGTPFADLSWSVRGRNVLVFVALDNLMKGAASQAVQNLNIMLGWDETLGLTHCFGGGV
jgi:N-acetyl-gamma-glutamyl-phosphate reductase